MTRPINHAAAVASACDEYAEDAVGRIEGATRDASDRDCQEIENIARLIIGLSVNVKTLVKRTKFAQPDQPSKYPLSALLVEAIENELTPAAHSVLAAMVAKMESEK